MKTLIISAIVASAALTGAASAQVGAGANAAIAHFNSDIDSLGDRVNVNAIGFDGTTVSTRSGDLGSVYGQFNADFDSTGDLRGLNGATLVGGQPAFGADILDRIKAEGLEDE